MIRFSSAAERDFKKLDRPVRDRIAEALRRAAPRPHEAAEAKRLRLAGSFWRLRVGDYRIVFEIVGPDLVVSVIAHRREVYRKLGRRLGR